MSVQGCIRSRLSCKLPVHYSALSYLVVIVDPITDITRNKFLYQHAMYVMAIYFVTEKNIFTLFNMITYIVINIDDGF